MLPEATSITSIPLAPSATYVVPSTSAPVSVTSSQLLDSQSSGVPLMPLDPLCSLTPSANQGLSLALAVEPVPAKLVSRITSGQFVEMRDLLGDNITLTQRIEEVHNNFPSYILPVSSRPRLREVSSLPSWIYCFLAYVSVGTTDPVVRDRLTYARLIIREAMRHGGRGWLDYDRLFRQQAALNPSLPWNALHPSLMASTILGQRSAGQGTFCFVCQGFDHTPPHCALAFLQQPTRQDSLLGRPSSNRMSHEVCWSWNGGQCSYFPAQCPRLHHCATCGNTQHKAKDCRDTPPDSRFKQQPLRRPTRPSAPTGSH